MPTRITCWRFNAVDADGQIDAAYLNPRPIHVSKAQATSESGKMNVMVEFAIGSIPAATTSLFMIRAKISFRASTTTSGSIQDLTWSSCVSDRRNSQNERR